MVFLSCFAIVLLGNLAHAAPIFLKAETVDSSDFAARLKPQAQDASEIKGRDVYLIQSEGVPTPEWRAAIEKTGAVIRSYIPENAYVVEADAEAWRALAKDVSYALLTPFKAKWRVDVSLTAPEANDGQNKSQGNDATAPGPVVCDVTLFDASYLEAVSARIAKLADCSVFPSVGSVVRAKLTAAAIAEVSSWFEVQWVEKHVPNVLQNNVAVDSARMNVKTVWPGGTSNLGLTGAGQVVAVADTGLDTGSSSTIHQDIRGRLVSAYALGRYNDWSDTDGHGTHVAGSVLGNGAQSSGSIKGTAYGARLIFQSVLDYDDELGGLPTDLTTLFDQAYQPQNNTSGARIHSNSWGAPVSGRYNSDSYGVDSFTFEHPDMLIVFSAGNEGVDANKNGVIDTDSMGAPATSKNCLTVGASENYRTSGGYSTYTWYDAWDDFPANPIRSDYISRPYNTYQGMVAFSSRGPCDDGRIKPDIVAPGSDILSLQSSRTSDHGWGAYNSYYCYMGGTSMATPLTSGTAALVREWLASNRGISNPDGATVKALLLAGAKSLSPGQYGTGSYREIPSSYPNNVEGWGQVNLGNTLVNAKGIIIKDAQVIAQGQSHTFSFTAQSGSPVSIIMAYADAPASLSSSKQLVNDLDLTVRTPSGGTLYPNSRSSADSVNNVEGVRISSAASGTYTVTVYARLVSTPMSTSLTGGQSNAIRYSLIVNGGAEQVITLPTAVDNSSLTFTTGGGASWKGQVSTTHDGVDAAESGDIPDNGNSWMQTTVTGPGTLTFWWKVSCESNTEITWDYLEFLIDGVQQAKIGGESVSWAQRTYSIGSGNHTLKWNYRKDSSISKGSDCGWVDQITWTGSPQTVNVYFNANGGSCSTSSRSYTVGGTYGSLPSATWSNHSFEGWYTASSGGERIYAASTVSASVTTLYAHWSAAPPTLLGALDNTALSVTTGGSASWFPQTSTSHDGVDAAQSGDISHNQSSWMQATVSGAGTFSFWWKVSSESGFDFLTLYVDGWRSRRISGSTSWAQVTLALSGSGTHKIKWTYSKDYSVSRNSDCGWVDQVTWGTEAALAPVYRFYSSKFKGHFFTISENEKCKIDRSDSNWQYETVAYRAYTRRVSGTVPLYRFYSSKFRGHFYTRNESEKNKVRQDRNWQYEGVAYYVYPSAVSGALPVHRFWSSKFKHHFYTMNEAEMWKIRNTDRNWTYEMIAFYALPNSSRSGTHAKSREAVAKTSTAAGISFAALDAEGVAIASGVRLETLSAGLPIEAGDMLVLGDLTLEARAEEPVDFAAGSPAPLGDAAPGLRLSLPENTLSPALWSAADGTLLEGEVGKDTFDFKLPASDVWHRLFIRDDADHEVWSLWLRALSGE